MLACCALVRAAVQSETGRRCRARVRHTFAGNPGHMAAPAADGAALPDEVVAAQPEDTWDMPCVACVQSLVLFVCVAACLVRGHMPLGWNLPSLGGRAPR